MADALFVYVTCPSEEAAHTIGRAVVEQRYAACANILPHMASIYQWQGKIETAAETVLIIKTVPEKWDALRDLIKTMHPYQVPCIIALPIEHGQDTYLQWIADETQSAS